LIEKFKEMVVRNGGQVVEQLPEDPSLYRIISPFGVAENGAVWIGEKEYKPDLFLAERVGVVVESLVASMEEGLARIDSPGLFMAGPSKTADVESFLVFGAHGPMELLVELKLPFFTPES